ncbi:NAD(P)H-hydrate dehydratase [Tistrella bauzanensis]|uniref:Bifunctional NAD(P)H-hydrate repair enzyme n=1 Tax=Tistrella arctica TaxID=3133430 RepID=A0ABU9YHR2_9PROT
MSYELLTCDEMGRADRAAIAGGIAGSALMEAAGQAVAREVVAAFGPQPRRVVVLAGPGNNGGDGWVAARVLAEAGWPVDILSLVAVARLAGDARLAADRWTGRVLPLSQAEDRLKPTDSDAAAPVVIDALFGAGLARPVDGEAARLLSLVQVLDLPVVAVDVPSGVSGDDGQVRGMAVRAALTVSFFRAKPGHWLLPGRDLRGRLVIADIGIPPAVLRPIGPRIAINRPPLWQAALTAPAAGDHKYRRGHLVVAGGPPETAGAARLAAHAGLRAGAGLVTVACLSDAMSIFAGTDPAVMTRVVPTPEAFERMLQTRRVAAAVLGPGQGVDALTRDWVRRAIACLPALVLDADALTAFEDSAADLFSQIRAATARGARIVITPHDGEFGRLFPDLAADGGTRIERVRAAADRCGAVVVLKGADTVIAGPDDAGAPAHGRLAINGNAPARLATAGAGDVLAGIAGGLLAQGMAAFEAAAAAVWLHGAAARLLPRGMIAEDIAGMLPRVLQAVAPSDDDGLDALGFGLDGD